MRAIPRRRFSANCSQRFITVQRAQLRADGSRSPTFAASPFDRDKLARSIRIAPRTRPVDQERIERHCHWHCRQLQASGENEFKSQAIGERVMETLKEVDPVAYVRFALVYRDFRETKDFEAFLGHMAELPKPAPGE